MVERIRRGRRGGRGRSGWARGVMAAVGLVGVVGVAAVTAGCSVDLRDYECSSDEYPVQAVGAGSGSACVTKGEEPPAGYVRYPAGQVPQRVGDKWDVYWQTHGLDAKGHLIKN